MKTTLTLSCLALLLALSGCAGKETFADKIEASNAELADIADQWREGKELKEEGEDMLEDAEDDLDEAEEQIEEGGELIDRGIEQAESNREAYRKLSDTDDDSLSPAAAAERNKKLQEYTENWQEGEADIAKGKKLIERGEALEKKATKARKKAEKMIERGEEMMEDAEDEYDSRS
ncbi:hypothetical protein Q4485_00095 [Granulosicoccaceae sp. 1_MG-2023]|nr:hypothetical protein [Granulosicoccaceae sp. 1_MG-2023]